MLITEHYGYLIFFITFDYVIEPNIFQLVSDFFTNSAFDFFTYSIVA